MGGEYRPPSRFERWGVPALVLSVVLLVFHLLHDEDQRLDQRIEEQRRRIDTLITLQQELERLQAEMKLSTARQFGAWCKGHAGVYVRGEEVCRLKDGTEIPYHPPFPVSDRMQGRDP